MPSFRAHVRLAAAALAALLALGAGDVVAQSVLRVRAFSDLRVAAHTGTETEPEGGHLIGDGLCVQGNYLTSGSVLPAMRDAFLASAGTAFESRLLVAVAAARDACGDKSGARSAAMKVFGTGRFPRTDLRVDWQVAPGRDSVDALAELVALWQPLIPFYERRPHDPTLGGWEDWLARGATA